jgi:Flp pilus assembly protein TadG
VIRIRDVDADSGSAVVEYTLVSTLLVFVFLGVVQVALVLHARNVLVADAAEGARAAAVRDATIGDGEQECVRLVRQALSNAVANTCNGEEIAGSGGEPPLVSMHIRAAMPLTFVPLGKVHLDVSARAIREPG